MENLLQITNDELEPQIVFEVNSNVKSKLNDYFECKENFEYFCRNYIQLELPGGNVLMQPYGPQLELIETIQDKKHVIVLKSRQIGITTIIQAYIVWLVTFYKNVVVGIISKNAPEATDFNRTIISMIENLPTWLRPKFKKKTEQTFILENGCKSYASSVNPNNPEKTLRGKAVTLLCLDEASFINHVSDAYTGIVPALSTNQKHARDNGIPYGTIILSTPNKTVGIGKWYYSKYQTAIAGDGIFTPFVIHWRQVKELASDPSWYNTQCQMFDNDPRKIDQELELKFIPAGGSFFPETTCLVLQDSIHKNKPIEISKIFNGEAWKFQNPIPGTYYIMGVDTATEYGQDKSAIVVLNYKTLELVWEYQGKLPVTDFCKIVFAAGSMYPGKIVIERNSVGNQVMESLYRSELVANVYSENRNGKVTNGLNVDSLTRPLISDSMYSYVTQFPESLSKSSRLSLELIGLVQKPSGRVEADTDCHDDLAMALGFCTYVRKYDPPMLLEQVGESMSVLNDVLSMNTEGFLGELTTDAVRTDIKKNPEKFDGWVDILSLYERD